LPGLSDLLFCVYFIDLYLKNISKILGFTRPLLAMLDFRNISLLSNAILAEAIKVIDVGHVQIAFVVDENKCLIGTITDGDIRRALLRGESLDAPVEKIMFRNFRALPASATEEEALALMRRETLHQIPALDEQGRVVRLFLLEELIKPKKRPNPVVIMAGGEGKRLRPLTQDCPKPMLRVGGHAAAIEA
jgi:CBS-domain-containing membrane protein